MRLYNVIVVKSMIHFLLTTEILLISYNLNIDYVIRCKYISFSIYTLICILFCFVIIIFLDNLSFRDLVFIL